MGASISRYWLVVSAFVAPLFLAKVSAEAATTNADEVKRIARIYSAVFDREPKVDGLNYWVDSYESGMTPVEISRKFYGSPEFKKRYGNLGARQYIDQLFRNVLGRQGKISGIDYWVGRLAKGASRAQVLLEFADSKENVAKTDDIFKKMRKQGGEWVFNSLAPAPQPKPPSPPQACHTYNNSQIYPSYASPFQCGAAGPTTVTIMRDLNRFWGSSVVS